MTLRAKKPTAIKKRFKALFFGSAGVGKTTASIHFPKPYLIDTERGAENSSYIEILDSQGGEIFQSSDFDEILQEVIALATTKHEFKTLIIDSLTIVYNNLLDFHEKNTGSDFGRHYSAANKSIKNLLNWILKLDMNVIITSHAKNEYGEKMNVLGQIPDGYKKLDYLFDLVIEVQRRGNKRIGFVKKSRISEFTEDENFEFSYQRIEEKYGKSLLEKEAVALELATQEQVEELQKYIDLLSVPSDTIDKWLTKAKVEHLKEMEADKIQKCIDLLKDKIR